MDDVTQRLRAAIAAGDFHPNERLVESDLVERFGASRFLVRGALVRLAQEGIIEHERNRGARVRLVDETEAVEVYETRASLEGLAAAKTAQRAAPAEVDGLRLLLGRISQLVESGDLQRASDANAALHAEILRLSGHATAIRLVDGLNSHLVRFQYRTMLHPDRPRRSLVEHAAIVEAIAAGDPEGAERAMRSHLASVTATLSRPIPAD